jgi:hypothetical protein
LRAHGNIFIKLHFRKSEGRNYKNTVATDKHDVVLPCSTCEGCVTMWLITKEVVEPASLLLFRKSGPCTSLWDHNWTEGEKNKRNLLEQNI